MRRQVACLYPKQGITDLQKRRAIFVALKLEGVERLLQKLRQISRTMKVRSDDAESLVHVAHRPTHELFPLFMMFQWMVTFQHANVSSHQSSILERLKRLELVS